MDCRKNAAKFPDAASHVEAAKILYHLAEATADIEPYVLDAYDELFEALRRSSGRRYLRNC